METEYLQAKYPKEMVEMSLDLKLIRRLLGYIYPYRWMTFIAILLLIFAKAIEAIVPIYIGHVVHEIMSTNFGDAYARQAMLEKILHECWMIIGVLVFGYILETLNVILKNVVSQKAIYTLRTGVYQHIINLPLKYFNTHAIGKLTTNTIYDVEQVNQMFTESVIPIIGSAILFICMCIGITFVDWRVAFVFAFIVPIVGWMTHYFRDNERYWYNIVRSILSVMNVFVQEHIMGASTIRTFGLQKQEKKLFEEINEDHRQANKRTIHYFSFFIAGIDFMQSLSLILVFVVLTLFALPGQPFDVGTFFVFSLYIVMLFRPLVDLADRYNILQSAMAAAERIFRILDESIEPFEPPSEVPLKEVESISFEDVWFAYDNEHWIFKGLSFEIKKGESIALVGVTGIGKTTVISLILRFYDIQKGSIKINGRDVREFPLHKLRALFSTVLQDPVIFSGTIRDNVGLYQPEVTDEKIRAAIAYVDLSIFLERYSDELDHYISERGQSLSAGEKQLLSLARAVAFDRSMFILDEATANIDVMTEHVIQEALNKLLKEKTSLVIAHRLATIRNVTRILVLNQGVVAEMGTHEELLQNKGLYEKLYRVQFLGR